MASDDTQESDNEAQKSIQDLPGISLLDHTAPTEELGSDAELSRAPSRITKTLTQGSIRQTLARRKYQRSKWQEGKGSLSDIKNPPEEAEEGEGSTTAQPKAASVHSQTNDGASDGGTWGQGRVKRGGRKVKDAILAPKQKGARPHTNDPDAHIDILYENQRGFFFAGIPRFSSNSLLNFDPGAWQDNRYRQSAVNITNAQVPDPSWEWAWRCWYVDMSGDVDEEGWEYSFWFKGSAWHGTHPWFHSFVRRRRWLRKRAKRKGLKPKEQAHALTSDYFTIHSKMKPAEEDSDSIATSEKKAHYSVATSGAWGAKSWEDQADVTEVTNIPDLLRGLKTAAIDREKIVIVRRFLDKGGEELHYLPENMEHIMKLLVFQNSRRQLLSILMHEFEAAEQHRDEHKERGEEETGDEKRQIDNLLKAVEAADDQCKQLEYWSDIRDMARDGEILRASDHSHGWDHGWQGLDASGPKVSGGSPTDALSDNEDNAGNRDKGKQPLRGTDDTDMPRGWVDGAAENKGSINTAKDAEDDASRPSVDSTRKDVFYSPEEEKSQAQAMKLPADGLAPSQEVPTPSQESQVSLDNYESAHSEPEDEEEDDAATEKAPSEDERNIDTPPTGATPIDALMQVWNGHAKGDKDTENVRRPSLPDEPQRRSWIEQAFF